MTKIPYVFLNYNADASDSDYWDMQLVKDILNGEVWQPARSYTFYEVRSIYQGDASGQVVIIPARHNAKHIDQIQAYILTLQWCILILTGDEERDFDYTRLVHPNMKIWLMQPKPEDKADFYLGSGYTPDTRPMLAKDSAHYEEKKLDWFFAGQINHPRRERCELELNRMLGREDMNAILRPTKGFTQGYPHESFYHSLSATKAAPAPSGIASPDSFRLFEALEAGAVPVADDASPQWPDGGFWQKVFQDTAPFKILVDYDNIEGYLGDIKRQYPRYSNNVFAWWLGFKKHMAETLNEHVHELSNLPYNEGLQSKITILMVTSPIKSHPSTEIIDQSITDLRKALPNVEIIIGIDGVRPEQEHYRERYEEYKKRLIWQCNFKWKNVTPWVFENHMHQSGMVRVLLRMVKTEAILFVEHDTSLAPDFDYPWEQLLQAIETGSAYTIRFHHEAHILDEHRHMIAGDVEDICGVPLIKTSQWSQRPHLSSTVFYRDMMDRYFTDDSRTMIEDKVHGFPAELYEHQGLQGWYQWRLWIYHPEGQIKRSYTTDGRGDDPKYDMQF